MGINSPLDHEKKENLVKAQGITYSLALDEMKGKDIHATCEIADYIVSVACEEAEGMYMYDTQGKLHWMIPEKNHNQHFEVVVQDKNDKRFLPGLTVKAKLLNVDKKIIEEMTVPFIWHPFLFHYGINISISKKGKYFAQIDIEKPAFHRHDQTYGKKYEIDVAVTLGPLTLTPGRKEYGEE
jgi:uncharacterized protein involved in high-affinity Fe2+ transport